MSLCDCAFGPRCESNRCCADENQSIGVKDPRTGEIRKRAKWTVNLFEVTGRKFHVNRIKFMCEECWQAFREAASKPLLGIDPPKHASDFWRPSIAEHIKLTHIRLTHDEKMREANEALRFAAFSERPMTSRERAMTPEHWKQTLFIRQKLREHAQRSSGA